MKNAMMAVGCIALWGFGCATIKGDLAATVRKKAAFDLGCAEEELKVSELSSGQALANGFAASAQKSFGAEGCGKRASYYAYCTNMFGSENCEAHQSSTPNAR